MTAIEREWIGGVVKRNGAWLCELSQTTDLTEHATPDQLYDVASSLTLAKRVLRQMAEGFGFGSLRWEQTSERSWNLHAADQSTPEPEVEW